MRERHEEADQLLHAEPFVSGDRLQGLLLAEQLSAFYRIRRRDVRERSPWCQRFSTNTFPPGAGAAVRVLCHNGEINTLRGNYGGRANRCSRGASSAKT
jgi:glutamate synthase domain-containing protein 1